MRFLIATALCMVGSIFANAQAADNQKDTYLKWFINYRLMETDTNKDNEISVEEIKADIQKLWAFYAIPQNFKFTDKNDTGTLDFNELKAMRYQEEGQTLQVQADDYDKFVETYSFKNISNIDWLKQNGHVANKIMSNYEWLENNNDRFNALAKTNWLGINSDIVADIAENYFLVLRNPELAKMLQTRYPKQVNTFLKSFLKYHSARSLASKSKAEPNKMTKEQMDKAAKAPKRSLN